MKVNIKHRCGHNGIVDVFGTQSERQSKLDWAKGSVCGECYGEYLARLKKRTSAASAKANRKIGCVPLEGSKAQIAYAETVRHDHLAALAKFRELLEVRIESCLRSATDDMEVLSAVDLTLLWAREISSAKWWLDNRAVPTRVFFFPSHIRVSRVASDDEMKVQLMILSPHTTEDAAKILGIYGTWLEAKKLMEINSIKAAQKAEAKRSLNDAIQIFESLGWKGELRRWQGSGGEECRLYLNSHDSWGVVHFAVTKLSSDKITIRANRIERLLGDPETIKSAADSIWHAMDAVGKRSIILGDKESQVPPKAKVPKAKVPKTEVPKTKVPKTKVPKTKVPKAKVPKAKVPNAKVPKTKVPKAKVSKTKVPNAKAPKAGVPNAKAPKAKIPKAKVSRAMPPNGKAAKTGRL